MVKFDEYIFKSKRPKLKKSLPCTFSRETTLAEKVSAVVVYDSCLKRGYCSKNFVSKSLPERIVEAKYFVSPILH